MRFDIFDGETLHGFVHGRSFGYRTANEYICYGATNRLPMVVDL